MGQRGRAQTSWGLSNHLGGSREPGKRDQMSDQKQRPTVTQAVLNTLSRVDASGLYGQRPSPSMLEEPAAETPIDQSNPQPRPWATSCAA